jgi:hypothetical protein
MTEWLTANPWPIAIPLALLAGLSFVHFRKTGRPRSGLIVVVLVLLVVVLFALDHFVQSPAEQVELVLQEMVEAAKRQDPNPILAAISRNYNHEGKTYEHLSGLVRTRLGEYQASSLQLNGLDVKAGDGQAEAKFVVSTSGNFRGHSVDRYLMRLTLQFRKEAGQWKITAIDRYELMGGTGEKIPLDRLR